MSYQTINLPNYNATINNLTVNGTLTGSVAPTGTAYTLAYYNSSGNLASSALTCDILGDISTSGSSSLNGGILVAQTANNNTNGLKLEQSGDTTRQAYFYMNNNELVITTSSNAGFSISSGNGAIALSSPLLFQQSSYFQSSQNSYLYWTNTGTWANSALSTAGSVIQVPSLTYQDTSTAASGTNAGPACVWSFNTPTLSASNTNVTTTKACTVYIGGAPIAGTNQTIPVSYSLYVNSGNCYMGGNLSVNGNLNVGDFVNFQGGTSSTATAGSATLPANPVGFIPIQVSGTSYKIPYYSS